MAKAGGDFDEFRINSACRKVEEWYVGDGWYADGPSFAFDYYSSYVFHPMYLETLQAMVDAKVNSRLDYQKYYNRELKRCQKYSIILERFISPEGTFPAFGRSIPYRMATMQPLALMAWYQKLPKDLSNGQVRAALTKVLHRMFDQQNNFNEKGYLYRFLWKQPEERCRLVYQQRFALYDNPRLHASRLACRPSFLDRRSTALDPGEGMEQPAVP